MHKGIEKVDTSGRGAPPWGAAAPAGHGFATGMEAFRAAVDSRMQALREGLKELFPCPRPAVLEIGAGHGHFLTSYAGAHPDHRCVGIDIVADRVRRANRKRERAGLEHLSFLQCEATEFLQCLPPGVWFDRIFVLFPDPWPKKRHHKNRLLSAAFLDLLGERTVSGGELFFRSDHLPYCEQVRATLGAHRRWQLREAARWPFEAPTVFQERAESYSSLVAERVG